MKNPVKYFLLCCICCALMLTGCAAPDGWVTDEAGTRYLIDGEYVTGWQEIEEKTYWFDSDGCLAFGWQEIDGATYYFDEAGSMAVGWQQLDGKTCYFREDGTRVTGWLADGEDRYYLYDDRLASGPEVIDGTAYLFSAQGKLTTGWLEMDGRRYWANADSAPAMGWQEIDGIRYLFGEDFAQQTGWLERDGFQFYFRPNGSVAQGKMLIDGQAHYFAFNGQKIILVNPWNYMPEDYEVELTDIHRGQQVATIGYEDYLAMMEACTAAGMDPVVCSSYRTHDYQKMLYNRRITRYVDQGYDWDYAKELAGRSVAIPGTSEHQLGLALDIIDSDYGVLDRTQAQMPTQQWLMAHSWEYGWILRYPDGTTESTGIIYEPWHYRYVGREVAADIHESGLCLEDYLESLTVSVG